MLYKKSEKFLVTFNEKANTGIFYVSRKQSVLTKNTKTEKNSIKNQKSPM